jgi:hypothetical protein
VLATSAVGTGYAATQRTLVAPTISDFTPKSGGEGTKLTITGTGFAGAKVDLFGVAATAVAVNAAGTVITANVPPPPGYHENEALPAPSPVSVRTPGGVANSATTFTFTGAASSPAPAAPAAPAPAAPAATKRTPVIAKYYTYKRNVKLTAGQSIHFAAGKGYYAA